MWHALSSISRELKIRSELYSFLSISTFFLESNTFKGRKKRKKIVLDFMTISFSSHHQTRDIFTHSSYTSSTEKSKKQTKKNKNKNCSNGCVFSCVGHLSVWSLKVCFFFFVFRFILVSSLQFTLN